MSDLLFEFNESTNAGAIRWQKRALQAEARVEVLEAGRRDLKAALLGARNLTTNLRTHVEVLEAAIQHVLNESTGGQLFAWRDGTIYRKAHRVPDISNHRLGLTVEIAEKPVDLSGWI